MTFPIIDFDCSSLNQYKLLPNDIVELGGKSNKYIKLQYQPKSDCYALSFECAPKPSMKLVEVTTKLNSLLDGQRIRMVETSNSTHTNGTCSFSEQVTQLKNIIHTLNWKTSKIRESYCPPVRTIMGMFNQLPVQITKKVSLVRKHDVHECFKATDRDETRNRSGTFIPNYVTTGTILPATGYLIQIGGMITNQFTTYRHRFTSLAGRRTCFIGALVFLFVAIVEPFRFLKNDIIKNEKKFQWENKAFRVLDAVYGTVFLPCLCVAIAVKMLAGAILHPGIIYKNIR